jgi:toxin YoeB
MASTKRVAALQDEFREDLRYWVDTNRKTALRVLDLMEATLRDPFEGIGKPEPLRHLGPELWSRRITSVDRLVYRVTKEAVDFLQVTYRY